MDMTNQVLHTTDATLDAQVLQSPIPVLVDIWGEWCGPCKAIAPLLDQLAQDYAGRLTVGKVEVDKNQKIAIAYGVRSAPTLLLFKHGKVQATQLGLVSKAAHAVDRQRALSALIRFFTPGRPAPA